MNTKNLMSKVAGVTFEGRQEIIRTMIGDETIQLRPEPENKYDPNAIAVWVAFPNEARMPVSQIGYLPREIAEQIAPHLDGESVIGHITEISGGFTKYDGSQASYGVVISVEYPFENE